MTAPEHDIESLPGVPGLAVCLRCAVITGDSEVARSTHAGWHGQVRRALAELNASARDSDYIDQLIERV